MIREVVKATGDIITVAGNGTAGYSGDNGPATAAELNGPVGVAVDSVGDLFIADNSNNVVREVVKATGDIITVAGNGTAGYSGDNGPATAAELDVPSRVAVDSAGDLFVADTNNNVVREFTPAVTVDSSPVLSSTTTALRASTSPSVYGQAITLTATVSSASGTPTGSVTLYNGAASLGTQPLINGTAMLVVTTLPVGQDCLIAHYAGNSDSSAARPGAHGDRAEGWHIGGDRLQSQSVGLRAGGCLHGFVSAQRPPVSP